MNDYSRGEYLIPSLFHQKSSKGLSQETCIVLIERRDLQLEYGRLTI